MSHKQAERAPEELGPSANGHREEARPVFEALLAPHRSLSSRGSLILLAAIAISSACVALRFWFLRAWPVIAFSGGEVVLVVLLLTINIRQARAREVIRLSAAEITVIQTDHHGRRRSFSLPSAWLQIRLETRDDHASRLLLRSYGRGREVAAFLHDPEKLSLFEGLRDALHHVRQPRFDNQQLHEP